jgi:integrase
MSVRKRTWTTPKGEERTAWVVDYADSQGKRRLKTFDRKKEADSFAAQAHVEVRAGTHVADSTSVTVEVAGRLWIETTEQAGRERTTVEQYRQHVDLHIVPFIGSTKLTALTVAMVRGLETDLLNAGRSPALVRKVLVSLGSLLADALERGLVARNVVREMRKRRGSKDHRAEKRARGKLRVGVDIPAPTEIAAIVGALRGRMRPLLLTAIFTGMRASELRGLVWDAVDLTAGKVRVYQRADRFKAIGKPKSEAGERTVPLPPIVVNTLREWKLAGTKSGAGLVFPDLSGEPQAHKSIVDAFVATQVRAGVVKPVLDDAGKPVLGKDDEPLVTAKYTGLHALRHFYASWCINRRADGGLELPAKTVQERLGHASITLTLDVYGHLFPSADEGAELAEAERLILTRG